MFSAFVVLIASGFFSVVVFPEPAVVGLVVCSGALPAASVAISAVVTTVGIEVATVMICSTSFVIWLTVAIVKMAIRMIERVVAVSFFGLGCIGFCLLLNPWWMWCEEGNVCRFDSKGFASEFFRYQSGSEAGKCLFGPWNTFPGWNELSIACVGGSVCIILTITVRSLTAVPTLLSSSAIILSLLMWAIYVDRVHFVLVEFS